jgi:hypothetical protein
MTKRKGDHVIMRNSNPFCSHCGESQVITYPIAPEIFSAICTAFTKLHKDCVKTWEEGQADQSMSEKDKAQWWLQNGERGTSSETIWGRMMGLRIVKGREDHPYDPDDFSRCYKLLKAVPEWRAKMSVMKEVSPQWSNLADNWDKLTEMYEQNEREEWKNYKKVGMYEFMQTLIK